MERDPTPGLHLLQAEPDNRAADPEQVTEEVQSRFIIVIQKLRLAVKK